jgi:thioredoxin 1
MDSVVVIRVLAGLVIGSSLGAVLGYIGRCTTGACPLTANPWRGAVLGGLIGILFSFPTAPPAMDNAAASAASTPAAAPGKGPIHIETVDQFMQEVLTVKTAVLVDFYSDSCPPCRALAPVISRLASQYQDRALVAKVNVDLLPQLAQRFDVSAIPTVVFFSQGKEVERLVGLRNEASYAQVLDRLRPAS